MSTADEQPGTQDQKPAEPAPPPDDGGAQVSADVRSLEAELESTRRELAETVKRLDEIARAYSASVNEQKDFRGRLEREQKRVLESERGNIALSLLEAVDELDRALSAAKGDEGPLAQGVRFIREGIMKRLTALGIQRIDLKGKSFDPMLAEAIDLVQVAEESQNDVVIDEPLPGYRLGDRVLRPARVRVGRFVPQVPKSDGPPAAPARNN